MYTVIKKQPDKQDIKKIDEAIVAHMKTFGLIREHQQEVDIEITPLMRTIGTLCDSKARDLASLRHEQIHSIRRGGLLLPPSDLNDLV